MMSRILSFDVDDKLLSSVRATCAELSVELEDLVKDYLSFLTNLDDSVIEEVNNFSNANQKAEWLVGYYFKVRASQL
ncbi:hypothetical protein KP742_00285 [Streptococcus equi subsp. zooepidemicus]|nr:hypothetical protein [Streptococcus equi subsp. zooepidemicus]HEL0663001.1 hypothetical protein [Streptococcus equi subsp. zooepidemicus]HEM3635084.1 hypothetical protein [Streptococcus suis]